MAAATTSRRSTKKADAGFKMARLSSAFSRLRPLSSADSSVDTPGREPSSILAGADLFAHGLAVSEAEGRGQQGKANRVAGNPVSLSSGANRTAPRRQASGEFP